MTGVRLSQTRFCALTRLCFLPSFAVVGPGQLMDVDGKAFASDFQLYNEKGSELTINGHVMPVTPVYVLVSSLATNKRTVLIPSSDFFVVV